MNPIIFILTIIIGFPVLAIIAYCLWFFWQTRSRRPNEDGYKYVYIEDNGSAREVTADERIYLETEFHPADGARPYIKLRYESLNGWGELSGFLLRRQLPKNIKTDQVSSNFKITIS
jgi:hypothetical protein